MSCTDLMLCEITNGVVTFILKLRFESSVVSYGSQTALTAAMRLI